MSDLPIQIVDDNDQPIGQASIGDAQQQGMIHRIARVWVENQVGKILLQKRAADKKLYPDCWDPAAAGHVDAGETYEVAAARELEEEVGIKGFPLEEIAYYRTNTIYKGLELNRFVKLYKAQVPNDTALKLQKEEVVDAKWFTAEEIQALAKNHPDKISDGLAEAIERLYN